MQCVLAGTVVVAFALWPFVASALREEAEKKEDAEKRNDSFSDKQKHDGDGGGGVGAGAGGAGGGADKCAECGGQVGAEGAGAGACSCIGRGVAAARAARRSSAFWRDNGFLAALAVLVGPIPRAPQRAPRPRPRPRRLPASLRPPRRPLCAPPAPRQGPRRVPHSHARTQPRRAGVHARGVAAAQEALSALGVRPPHRRAAASPPSCVRPFTFILAVAVAFPVSVPVVFSDRGRGRRYWGGVLALVLGTYPPNNTALPRTIVRKGYHLVALALFLPAQLMQVPACFLLSFVFCLSERRVRRARRGSRRRCG